MITVRTSPAYVNRVRQDWTANGGVYGDGGVYAVVPSNDPFAQLGPTLDLSFTGNAGNLSGADTYTLDTNFITPQYQIAAQYAVWVDGSGMTQRNFADIVTFSRTSGATWFNSAGVLQGVDFSVTSNTIGTGSKTFTLDATAGVNRYWATGDTVLISDQSNSSNNMTGTVTSYTASTQVLVVNVTSTGGSGTIASWRIGSTMPRFDFNPSTLAAQGLLIEEQRTNSIRNNTMQGAVAGTPGTLPTNWNVSGLGALTQQVVGTGTVNGVTYIDLRFSGTTSTTQLSIRSEPGGTGAIAAANGQTWAMSMWSAVVAGGFTNINAYGYGTLLYDAVGAFIGAPFSNGTINTTSTLTRTQTAGTIATAGTAFIQPQVYFTFSSGVAIDFTLRIGLPQLENNNISTGVASATVASGGSGYAVGDVLQIVGGTGTAARLTVATLSGSAVATVTVSTAGSYSVFPSPQPVSVTAITGTGTSATFNIVPQTQTGFATSVIPTTVAQVTRNRDEASVNTLSPWYNASAGTVYAEFLAGVSVATQQAVFDIDNSSDVVNNRISWRMGNEFVTSAGSAAVNFFITPTASATSKWAFAFTTDDFAFSRNGGAPSTDSSGALPSGLNRMLLGNSNSAAGTFLNGYLRRITYYPRRLANADLQTITA